MNAESQPFTTPDRLSHLLARKAQRATDSVTPSKDATRFQVAYAEHINGFYNDLMAQAGSDEERAAVTREMTKCDENYRKRLGAYLSALASRDPRAEEKYQEFEIWWRNAQTAVRKALGAEPAADFELVVDRPELAIRVDHAAGIAQVLFVEKPHEILREALKADGWRWQRADQAWQKPLDVGTVDSAKRILGLSIDGRKGFAGREDTRRAAAGERGRA